MLTVSKGEFHLYLKIVLGFIVVPILFFLLVWLLIQLRSVLILFLFALVFVFLLRPVVDFFSNGKIKLGKKEIRFKIPRLLSVLLTYILLMLIIFWILFPAFQILIGQANDLASAFNPDNISKIKGTIEDLVMNLTKGSGKETISKGIDSAFIALQDTLKSFTGVIVKGLADLATTAAGILFNAFIIMIITTFFLLDWRYINAALFAFLPDTARTQTKSLMASISSQIWGYVGAQALLSVLTGTLIGILALILGLPSALLIGIIVAMGEMVPYIGPLISFSIGLILATVSSLTSGGSLWTVLYYIIGFLVIEQGLAQAIAAPVLAKKAQTHPLLVILVMFSFYNLFGPLSVLLAVPFLVFIKSVIIYLNREHKLFKRLGIDLNSYYNPEAQSPLIARLRQPFTQPKITKK